MRVFMLGWEFPPFISGGLGTACHGLTRALSAIGTDVLFVLPRPVANPLSTHVKLLSPWPGSRPASSGTEMRLDEFDHVTFQTVDAGLTSPYLTGAEYAGNAADAARDPLADAGALRPDESAGANYAGDLFAEVERYAALAGEIARRETFDIIHAHDWMTYPAALSVAGITGKPLVVHVHSTEFDRSGVHVDRRIGDIERRSMQAALKVIAVSHLTKNQITRMYGIEAEKVEVVYNGIEIGNDRFDAERACIGNDEKIVLFLGRLTHQKGPEYFLAAAKKVLEVMDNVKFVMAGSGDMARQTIEMASAMGIGRKVLFTGFLRGGDVDKIFNMADLYVMPSVSEPFGIAPLEAMSHDVPVIISKQSGVSEVLSHALKVDFWDITEMADKIVAVLKHPPLARTLRQHGGFEVRQLQWADSARQCVAIYEQVVKMMGVPGPIA